MTQRKKHTPIPTALEDIAGKILTIKSRPNYWYWSSDLKLIMESLITTHLLPAAWIMNDTLPNRLDMEKIEALFLNDIEAMGYSNNHLEQRVRGGIIAARLEFEKNLRAKLHYPAKQLFMFVNWQEVHWTLLSVLPHHSNTRQASYRLINSYGNDSVQQSIIHDRIGTVYPESYVCQVPGDENKRQHDACNCGIFILHDAKTLIEKGHEAAVTPLSQEQLQEYRKQSAWIFTEQLDAQVAQNDRSLRLELRKLEGQ